LETIVFVFNVLIPRKGQSLQSASAEQKSERKEVCRMETVRLNEFGKDLGLAHEMIVTARKVTTSEELIEFLSKLADDKELLRSTVDTVLGRGKMTAEERLALEILGKGKVIGYRDACRIWQVDQLEDEPVLPYKDILREAAEANESGADWRLVYCTGLSLRAQLEVIGNSRNKQPCFDENCEWWLEIQHDEWANKAIKSGYRLLDFSCPFTSKTWKQQRDTITESGEQFARAEEQAVAEACLGNYILNGKERLLQNRYHWGHLRSASDDRVCVGRFGEGGFDVFSNWDDNVSDRLGVVRVWKGDCPS